MLSNIEEETKLANDILKLIGDRRVQIILYENGSGMIDIDGDEFGFNNDKEIVEIAISRVYNNE